MPRVVSFIVLLAVVLLIGSLFFQVMLQFIVPLFLAAVMVVIFKPLHQWLLRKCGGRQHIAAALTTLTIVLIVLLPLSGMVVKAVSEGVAMVRSNTADGQLNTDSVETLIEKTVEAINRVLAKLQLPPQSFEEVSAYVQKNLDNVVTPLLLGGVEILVSTIFSLAIMVLTMYYFFADGPNMAAALMKLSPMDDTYEKELLEKFADISRAVVLATLLSAIVQGLLAGAGYLVAGVGNIFLWTALTIFMAMVPFVGAAAVWGVICLYLYFVVGHTTAAWVLGGYCLTVVSMSDNLVKPMVLHGQANLHPLLALLSVIGGVQALGPIGILVGPMVVAFLQALLNMLNKELHQFGKEADEKAAPA
ncbi:MAG: AI-2E family transporter [Pirellulales bacterium]|nr:AI-2E family transporter [Pirellulales bacterium]